MKVFGTTSIIILSLTTEIGNVCVIVAMFHHKALQIVPTVYLPSSRNCIFQNLTFSERPQEKYYHVTILLSKSLKKSHKNRLTNKTFMPENDFE